IQKNFTKEVVTDGSTGIFLIDDEFVADGSVNLIKAYGRLKALLRSGRQLTVEDIENVRRDAMDTVVVGDGKIISSPVRYKKRSDRARFPRGFRGLHKQVERKLEQFGYSVQQSQSHVTIGYNDRVKENLANYVERLNQMIANGDNLAETVVFAIQDFLIIHPFNNGNGRTARAIGQALIEYVSGHSIVFPKQFHREMNYAPKGLVDALVTANPWMKDLTINPSPALVHAPAAGEQL
ncbi:MAG TPA: Fic family protein, partial [Bdellovibrionales bacterium]|nr:Fic family protein [Bdellovibrionales bacterium]